MARMRTIKPEFFTSEAVSALPVRARLTWIGVWTQADDEGRMRDNARLLHAALYPLDDEITADDVESDLHALHRAGRIVRYEVDGKRYLQVTNFREHQKPNRPNPSILPGPGAARPAPSEGAVHGALTEDAVHGPVTATDQSGSPHPRSSRGVVEVVGGERSARARADNRPVTDPAARQLVDRAITAAQPKSVLDVLAAETTALLAEGIAPDTVEAGLRLWATKSLGPRVLASVVAEVMRAATATGGAKRPTSEQRVADIQALKRRPSATSEPHLRAISGGENP
jgi:hypothetical protein